MANHILRTAGSASQADEWRAGAVVVAVVVVLFALYCQAHGWVEARAVPMEASIRWGLVAGAPTGAIAWLGWSKRNDLSRVGADGVWANALLVAGVFLLLICGGAILHLLALQSGPSDVVAYLVGDAFDLMPVAAALALGVSGLLWATRSKLRDLQTTDPSRDWLTIPEAPNMAVRVTQVVAIQAAGNYCELQTDARNYLVRIPIKVIAQRLEPAGFVRVHRSTLINLGRLSAVERVAGQVKARLDDGSLIQIGSAYRQQLEMALSDRSSHRVHIRP